LHVAGLDLLDVEQRIERARQRANRFVQPAEDQRSGLSRTRRTKAPINAGISAARVGSLLAGIVRLSRN
jgi:hypothetical protein